MKRLTLLLVCMVMVFCSNILATTGKDANKNEKTMFSSPSPDGKWQLFVRPQGESPEFDSWEIHFRDLKSGKDEEIDLSEFRPEFISWDEKGKRFAYLVASREKCCVAHYSIMIGNVAASPKIKRFPLPYYFIHSTAPDTPEYGDDYHNLMVFPKSGEFYSLKVFKDPRFFVGENKVQFWTAGIDTITNKNKKYPLQYNVKDCEDGWRFEDGAFYVKDIVTGKDLQKPIRKKIKVCYEGPSEGAPPPP